MLEDDWLNSTDPKPMLHHLQLGGPVSGRKLRLFAVGCCRLIWPVLADQGSWSAVEMAERHADGQAGADEMTAAAAEAWVDAARAPAMLDPWEAAWHTAEAASMLASYPFAGQPYDGGKLAALEQGNQAALLRDVFGHSPFHAFTALDPLVLRWNDGVVRKLAEAVYLQRDFSPERLAVLADALEEANWTNAELLGHLRGSGTHTRGCWALDQLLGFR